MKQPPISEYALLGDCETAALVCHQVRLTGFVVQFRFRIDFHHLLGTETRLLACRTRGNGIARGHIARGP